MNANLPPKTPSTSPTYNDWLREATELLSRANIASARLDAELILAHTIRKPRVYVHAHGDEPLSARHDDIASARLELRLDRTPIAYIVGHKEFYGRRFKTTPAALIPRPESETIITLLKDIVPANLSLIPEQLHVLDVGTGTGILGITAKLEWPELDVTLTDIDKYALNLARENADRLCADVHFLKANLLHGVTLPIDILIANLPYIDRHWDVSPDTHAEPELALYAADGGLALIRTLLQQSALLLKPGAHLLLESDTRRHDAIVAMAKESGYRHRQTEGFITHFVRR
jgi:release factor glutamine methyltransferase